MSNRSSSAMARARGCSWCKNAGRPEWRFHNLKDSRGRTTCPVLLEILCRTCGRKGHTRKHCPHPKEKRQSRGKPVEPPPPRPRLRSARVKVSVPRASGPFSALAPDSSSSEDEETERGTPPSKPVLTRQTNGSLPPSPWSPEPSVPGGNGLARSGAIGARSGAIGADRPKEDDAGVRGGFRFGVAGPAKRSWADSDSDSDGG